MRVCDRLRWDMRFAIRGADAGPKSGCGAGGLLIGVQALGGSALRGADGEDRAVGRGVVDESASAVAACGEEQVALVRVVGRLPQRE